MPVDRKRINGPEVSWPYNLYTTSELVLPESNSECLATRYDDRKDSQHRAIFLQTGVVTQAKGSAYLELGDTRVLVSVYDPREIPNRNDYFKMGVIYCEFKFAPFSCPQRCRYQQTTEEKMYSSILRQALESAVCLHEFPNFQVDIYVYILQNAGSVISAAITAAGAALVQAGVPMYGLVAAATYGVCGDLHFLDPTREEEDLCDRAIITPESDTDKPCHGLIIMAILQCNQQVSLFYQKGYVNVKMLENITSRLFKSITDIFPLLEKNLVKYVMKTITDKDQNE